MLFRSFSSARTRGKFIGQSLGSAVSVLWRHPKVSIGGIVKIINSYEPTCITYTIPERMPHGRERIHIDQFGNRFSPDRIGIMRSGNPVFDRVPVFVGDGKGIPAKFFTFPRLRCRDTHL